MGRTRASTDVPEADFGLEWSHPDRCLPATKNPVHDHAHRSRRAGLTQQKGCRLAPPRIVDMLDPVVVVGGLYHRESPGIEQRLVKCGAEAGGHDAVARGDRHKNGATERREVGGAVVTIAQQPSHR